MVTITAFVMMMMMDCQIVNDDDYDYDGCVGSIIIMVTIIVN